VLWKKVIVILGYEIGNVKMGKKLNDYKWEVMGDGTIPNHNATCKQVKELLNTTGPGFCLAKFRQVTLHLGTMLGFCSIRQN